MTKLFSIQEAADLLSVNPETLRRWDRSGRLVAVKINERGDRKYRYRDLQRIKAKYQPEKYKGFDIIPYSLGFELFTDRLGTVASFIIRSDKTISVFAFAVGGLIMFANPNLSDDNLLVEAKEIIKKYIDNNSVKHLEEYTFEYHPCNFVSVNNPPWWIKSLKKYYSGE